MCLSYVYAWYILFHLVLIGFISYEDRIITAGVVALSHGRQVAQLSST